MGVQRRGPKVPPCQCNEALHPGFNAPVPIPFLQAHTMATFALELVFLEHLEIWEELLQIRGSRASELDPLLFLRSMALPNKSNCEPCNTWFCCLHGSLSGSSHSVNLHQIICMLGRLPWVPRPTLPISQKGRRPYRIQASTWPSPPRRPTISIPNPRNRVRNGSQCAQLHAVGAG